MALSCKIELNKTSGITVTVTDADKKITQTITMDGNKLTIKVKGDKATSTIIQDQESIAISCDKFTLDAKTITCTSEEATKHVSKDVFGVESTKDLTLKSEAKIVGSATGDMALTGQNFTATGKTEAGMYGGTGTAGAFRATASDACVEGMAVALTGNTEAELSSPSTTVEGQGTLTLTSSGQAKLQGNMTEVGGSMVKIG